MLKTLRNIDCESCFFYYPGDVFKLNLIVDNYVKVLLLDNYDSFTYNIYHLIGRCADCSIDVVKNDESTYEELLHREYDFVVISPGPGTPKKQSDLGVSRKFIQYYSGPLLGVCLGHQGIAHMNGANVIRGNEPMHGRISPVFHNANRLFRGIPSPFNVVRYHSLIVDSSLPDSLVPIAMTDDDVVMAVEHKNKPQWGVQFHPESICSQYGEELFTNFFAQNDRSALEFTNGQFTS